MSALQTIFFSSLPVLPYLCSMKDYEIPVRNILKYSLVFSLTIALITFLSSFMQEESWSSVIYRIVSTFLLFYSFSMLNLCLLKGFYTKGPLRESYVTINDKRHFACGVFCTSIIFFGFHFLNMYLMNKGLISPTFVRSEVSRLGNWLYFFLFLMSIVVYAVVYFLHNFIILQDMKVKVDLENSRLRTVNAETVNQLLRQQIQPHFLFNALNVLKSLIRKYPDTAEESLISLSDFLRASVNQNKKVLVPLAEELKICHDYMEMQKIRFGNALNYQVNITDTESGYLPVFSLQPLLENAIKHNELTNSSPLRIEISDHTGWVEVKNNLQPKRSLSESTGNGLSNLSERYRILSGDPVQIVENQEEFIVKIKILHAENLLSPTNEIVEL